MLDEKIRQLDLLGLTEAEYYLRGHAFNQIKLMAASGVTYDVLASIINNGVNYEALLQKLRIAFSYVDQKLREKILKGQEDASMTIQASDAMDYLHH